MGRRKIVRIVVVPADTILFNSVPPKHPLPSTFSHKQKLLIWKDFNDSAQKKLLEKLDNEYKLSYCDSDRVEVAKGMVTFRIEPNGWMQEI